MLAAVSIICGKFLALNLTPFMRFSFENLPIIFAGAAFGPIGALVGAVADLVGGFIVYGGDVNPIITLGSASIGLVSGFAWRICGRMRMPHLVRVIVTVLSAHLIGSVIIKSLALTVYLELIGLNAVYEIPLIFVMLWRLLNYAIVGTAEGILLYFLLKNKLILSAIGSTNRVGGKIKEKK